MLSFLFIAVLHAGAHGDTTGPAAIPAQEFRLDPSHASLVFSVNHLGLTNYTAGFDSFDATLTLDPANPAAAKLTATINPSSLDLPSPPEGFLDAMLAAPWFDVATYPAITFTSDSVTLTDEDSATVTGQMTMLGASAPVTLQVDLNGAIPAGTFEPHARIGFSATGEINRSAFGMTYGVPEPGSTAGVGDLVTFRIEAEFTGTIPAE
ncbi:YceI family protein [Roseovarius sp. 2305UL8-3]|uniref:YceI family protein n=1 Tax=Roseovarius conchicola TaxID=3121636 RepID=UPI003526D564